MRTSSTDEREEMLVRQITSFCETSEEIEENLSDTTLQNLPPAILDALIRMRDNVAVQKLAARIMRLKE